MDILSIILICCLLLCVSSDFASNSLKNGEAIVAGENKTLLSTDGTFEFGFFSPEDTRACWFLGMRYSKVRPSTFLWVANDHPVTTGGIFKLQPNGSATLDGTAVFAVGNTSAGGSDRTLRITDAGNLQLTSNSSNTLLWQSFDYPTNTFLQGMKMSQQMKLTSWRPMCERGNVDDDENVPFTLELENHDQLVLKKKSSIVWKSPDAYYSTGSPNTQINRVRGLLANESVDTLFGNGSVHSSEYKSILIVNSTGTIELWNIDISQNVMTLSWSAPQSDCSKFGFCGKYSSCSEGTTSPRPCRCLRGFKSDDPSSDCSPVQPPCSFEGGREDEFEKYEVLKVIKYDTSIDAKNETDCQRECLVNCKCKAYSFQTIQISIRGVEEDNGNVSDRDGCFIWNDDITDLEESSSSKNSATFSTINVRFTPGCDSNNNRNGNCSTKGPAEGSGQNANTTTNNMINVIVLVSVVSLLGLGLLALVAIRIRTTLKFGRRRRRSELSLQAQLVGPIPNSTGREEFKAMDVPHFSLEMILKATNSFSDENKLGQGGFGPVYKGIFPGGEEIAVKRLSSKSGQGLEEFKTEVTLIAKLQHRNLVRLLGYCVQGDEKILVYEYMQNRSLDAFVFDPTLSLSMDWNKRFQIITGIARGLLYLHHDSRLRIVHRDLKTSNILLDNDMTPKIADFGLARIMGGSDTEANTMRVAGTFGYMSPEYALNGLFSIKSDVFSFGVILLEVISGRKNTGFYNSDEATSLLGYAWKLWSQDNKSGLLDPAISLEECQRREVERCISVGLLCVQEFPGDRPTMSTVIFALANENAPLPVPKQPAFVERSQKEECSTSGAKISTGVIIQEAEIRDSFIASLEHR